MKRFFILAITITVLTLCNHVSHTQEKTNPPQNPISTSSTKKTDVPAVTRQEQQQQNAKNEHLSANFDTDDLTVQKRMVDAAEEANKLVKRQNIIGIIGLGLVFITAVFAGGAWYAAGKATKIASEANIAQFRPVLTFENIRFTAPDDLKVIEGCLIVTAKWKDKNDLGFNLGAIVEIKNWGQTPVFNITCKAQCEMGMIPNCQTDFNSDIKSGWSPVSLQIHTLPPSFEKEVNISIWVNGETTLDWKVHTREDGSELRYIALPLQDIYVAIKGQILFQDIFTIENPFLNWREYRISYSGFPFKPDGMQHFHVVPEEVHKNWKYPDEEDS